MSSVVMLVSKDQQQLHTDNFEHNDLFVRLQILSILAYLLKKNHIPLHNMKIERNGKF